MAIKGIRSTGYMPIRVQFASFPSPYAIEVEVSPQEQRLRAQIEIQRNARPATPKRKDTLLEYDADPTKPAYERKVA